MTNGDIHNRSKSLQNLVDKIKESSKISERDKNILVKGSENFPSFLTYMRNQNHSNSRIIRYLRTWKKISEHIEWKIEDVSKTKITELIGDLNTDKINKKNGKPYAESTKTEFKKGIRKMYTDFFEIYSSELNLEKRYNGEKLINFTLTYDKNYTDPERLPNPFHVKELIENLDRPKEKAYVMLLWSTGGRHGEVLGLQWKDVSFSGATGTVTFRDTKTGGDHTVPMAESMPFVRKHMENDSKSNEPDTYLFRSRDSDKQYSAGGASKILERARERADIPSKIKTNPHAFRKGRTVYWIRQGQNEAWICKHMNWVPGSDTVVHYARVAKEDVEKGVARHLGLEQESNEREESKVLTPCECHACGYVNSFKADTCKNCNEVLSSSEMFEEVKLKEATDDLVYEYAKSEKGYTEEELKEKAKELLD